ncbi:MAG: 50S ribosomal protein L6 [Candidatus Micrarchaeaceae archaeon]
MEEVKVPNGVKVSVEGGIVKTAGALGNNSRKFNAAYIDVKVNGDSVQIIPTSSKKLARKALNIANAFASELRNDISGVQQPFKINMSIVFSHFPLTLEVSGKSVLIKNMLGERYPRRSNIVGDTKVEVKGNEVKISGPSKDDVSQTAANLRRASKIRKRDERIFQDGVYYAAEV